MLFILHLWLLHPHTRLFSKELLFVVLCLGSQPWIFSPPHPNWPLSPKLQVFDSKHAQRMKQTGQPIHKHFLSSSAPKTFGFHYIIFIYKNTNTSSLGLDWVCFLPTILSADPPQDTFQLNLQSQGSRAAVWFIYFLAVICQSLSDFSPRHSSSSHWATGLQSPGLCMLCGSVLAPCQLSLPVYGNSSDHILLLWLMCLSHHCFWNTEFILKCVWFSV